MRYAKTFVGSMSMALSGLIGLGTLMPAASIAAVEGASSPPAVIVASTWEHRKATINYFGVTSLYTCQGLEDQVRQMLRFMGARKDMKVQASGCPGLNAPSHSAWVDVDFYSLAPAADAAANTVPARWTELKITPQHPNFMSDGDCELMQSIKEMTTKSFSLRDLEYRTSCFPHSLSMDGFSVKGETLKLVPPEHAASARESSTSVGS